VNRKYIVGYGIKVYSHRVQYKNKYESHHIVVCLKKWQSMLQQTTNNDIIICQLDIIICNKIIITKQLCNLKLPFKQE